ncbi:MAG: hypothetical protein MI741_11235, partial [Rhodospirillales bacterium]|nr:hypothetical protein [Rhodospirillales bacterium]
ADLILGDMNHDGLIDSGDIDPFVDAILGIDVQLEADMNFDGYVNGLDVQPFIDQLTANGAITLEQKAALVALVPEPGTLGALTLLLVVLPRRSGKWRDA